ncbi:MAG: TraB/GumN family protein, partial [Pseudomonadota bacterium]|nr:TraB/GumN family protein [Pseudomonadota bacterium]
RDLAPVVVSGVQPGPGMWRVSRDGRVLHLLGTLSPLPRDIEWLSRDVDDAIAGSQEILQSPSVTVSSGVGMFRSMLLIPAALKARRNPDGRMLSDVVPAGDYARWSILKARYIGRDRKVEQWRPVFAAQELYSAAIGKSGLSRELLVEPMVAKAAKRHDVPVTPVQVQVVIEDPRTALQDFSSGALDDSACFEKTLVRIESDLDAMRLRANAWAVGDLEQLRALPYTDHYTTCISALTGTGLAQRLGVSDLRAQMEHKWLAEAQRALAQNQSTFAALPIREMLRPDGLLSTLEALGYEVQAP